MNKETQMLTAIIPSIVAFNTCMETEMNFYVAAFLAILLGCMSHIVFQDVFTTLARQKRRDKYIKAGYKKIRLRNGRVIWRHRISGEVIR